MKNVSFIFNLKKKKSKEIFGQLNNYWDKLFEPIYASISSWYNENK